MIAKIEIPGVAALLERFLAPLAATSGDGVEITQDGGGTTVSVCDGRHAATITTPTAGTIPPMLVDPAALAKADATKPIAIYRTGDATGVIQAADGSLIDITIRPGTLSPSARAVADVVDGEIASGMTKQTFEIDPRHLAAVAESLVLAGVERCTVTVAPRHNVLAFHAVTAAHAMALMVAGESFDATPATATPAAAGDEDDDPLTFTVGAGRSERSSAPRAPRKRRPTAAEKLHVPDDLPF